MLALFKKSVEKTHVNPRIRAYGKARIDIARRATSRADWDRMWKQSTFPFPFSWGESWKQCMEYRVVDFPAEVGFYIDILGLPVNAFDPDYAMFTSPNGEFYFSVVPAPKGDSGTPPEAIRIQFLVDNILEVAEELERRGIAFEHWPSPCAEGSSLYIGSFRTPHGICIELWGSVADDYKLEDEKRMDDVGGSNLPADYETSQPVQASFTDPAESTSAGVLDEQGETIEEVADPSGGVEESEVELLYEYLDEEEE
jgi:catechol 2,3-dioxygenase-like lactoylglutathione lyase family enzyme